MAYEELESKLGYSFTRKGLLVTALTHTSYANEKFREDGHLRSNERLEFVGDSVVGLVVAGHLYDIHPDWPEGRLSKVRASVVCEETLAKLAESLGVPDYIRLGTGESQTNGRHKPSILADAMESIVAAVYMDSDFDTARKVILPFFVSLIDEFSQIVVMQDCKTRLQEILGKKHITPRYFITNEQGPMHERVFSAKVTVEIDGREISAEADGKSKRDAEQHAAGILIEKLGAEK